MRPTLFVLALMLLVFHLPEPPQEPSHIRFDLVRGTVGFVSSTPNGIMTEAPNTVLAFTLGDGQKTLVLSDHAGDYTAVLQPGHYCVAAYNVKTGDLISLDARQLKCIDVTDQRGVRLDVMLTRQDSQIGPGQLRNRKGSR